AAQLLGHITAKDALAPALNHLVDVDHLAEPGVLRVKHLHTSGHMGLAASSCTTTNGCTRRWVTAPRARCSSKPFTSPVTRGEKTLVRAQHYQHNEMQTRVGSPTLGSPDR